MVIDTSIIDTFIKDKSDENIKNHWVFGTIVEGRRIYEEPEIQLISEYEDVRDKILRSVQHFKPINIGN